MVVEELFKERWAEKRPLYSFLLGIFFTIISFFTSYLLFRQTPNFIGISTILFTVMMVIPTVNKLFDREEKLEAKEKLSFFVKHEHIIDFFIYFFIGVFIILFIIAITNPQLVFSEQQLYNIQSAPVEEHRNLPPPPRLGDDNSEMTRIFQNNFYVMALSFILSLFYGAGALFLITLNASIFASALATVIRTTLPAAGIVSNYTFTLCNLGIMFFHMIPEVTGYLLAAIAGGVLSHAFVREKIGSKKFKNVVKDSIALIIAAIVFLIVAAFIENEISKQLFTSNVCTESKSIIIIVLGLIVGGILLFEILRKKKFFGK